MEGLVESEAEAAALGGGHLIFLDQQSQVSRLSQRLHAKARLILLVPSTNAEYLVVKGKAKKKSNHFYLDDNMVDREK